MIRKLTLTLVFLGMSLGLAYADSTYFTPVPNNQSGYNPGLTASPTNNAYNTGKPTPTTSQAVLQTSQETNQNLASMNTQLQNMSSQQQALNQSLIMIWNNFVKMHASEEFPTGSGSYLQNTMQFNLINQLASLMPNSNSPSNNSSGLMSAGATPQPSSGGIVDQVQYAPMPSATGELGASLNQQNQLSPQASYMNSLVGMVYDNSPSSSNIQMSTVTSSVAEVVNQIIQSRTATSNGMSQMAMLNSIVNASMQQNWLNSIATSSESQLLRTMAIQLSVNNYLAYQRYQQEQATQLLMANQVVLLQKILGTLQSIKQQK